MTPIRAFGATLAGILVAVVTVVAAAPPASAAAPPCTGWGLRHDVMESGALDPYLRIYFPAHTPDEATYGGEGYWSCSLVQGSQGEGVEALQTIINQCYVPSVVEYHLEVDGDFGSLTKAALVEVQRRHGIVANGQYGPQTARTIYHASYNPFGPVVHGCARLTHFGWPGNSPK